MVVLKFLKVIRNNWKKSVFGSAVTSYGISYGIETYNTEQLMREYCEKVVKYGDQPLPNYIKPRHITVILNPAAKKRKAKKLFEKYCEPLLHLAGIAVTIIQAEPNGETRNIVANLKGPTDAIVVAGGDGTLSDVVTGLMRKYKCNVTAVKQCPIGILPLGETNRTADCLYNTTNNQSDVHEMAEAALAIINGKTRIMDIIEVEPLEPDDEHPIKPVYAMGEIKWGSWSYANARTDKYWYWGPLRKYAAYLFGGTKESVRGKHNATLRYTDPCNGCSECYQKEHSLHGPAHSERRWWHAFVRRKYTFDSDNNIDYSKVTNEKCSVLHEVPVSTSELHIKSNVNDTSSETSSLKLCLGPDDVDYKSFVAEGWRHIKGTGTLINPMWEAKSIELLPDMDKEQTFFIDNEAFEMKPLKIKLIHNAVKVFCDELYTRYTS